MYMIKVIALKQQKNKEIELFTATLKPLKKREMRLFLKHNNNMVSDLQDAIKGYKKHRRPQADKEVE